jgi:hypothetical protein
VHDQFWTEIDEDLMDHGGVGHVGLQERVPRIVVEIRHTFETPRVGQEVDVEDRVAGGR